MRNFVTDSVHKMIKHSLKISQQIFAPSTHTTIQKNLWDDYMYVETSTLSYNANQLTGLEVATIGVL